MPLDTVARERPFPARMSPGVIVLTITLLLALQPITTDLYLPSLPTLQRELGASVLAPLTGGLLVHFVSWHAALLSTAVFGAATLAFIACKFDETLPGRNPRATEPAELLRNWSAVIGHPTFRAWVLLLCCTWGGLFLVLAGSSFVFINMRGTPRIGYGLILASCSLAYIVGTLICRKIGLFLGGTLDHSALPVTLGVGAFSIVLALVAWTLVQRDGNPADAWHAPSVPEPAR